MRDSSHLLVRPRGTRRPRLARQRPSSSGVARSSSRGAPLQLWQGARSVRLPPLMEATIREGQAPALVVQLGEGEEITGEAGAMMFITGNVAMDAEAAVDSVKSGIKRAFAGESVFHVRYKAGSGGGVVGLTGPYPGSIREHELDGEIICERHAYLCHHGEIAVEPILAMKRGMGIAGGGEGFVLQKISGKGTVWLHAGGDFVDFDLVEGQNLVVDTGCMVMFESSVKY